MANKALLILAVLAIVVKATVKPIQAEDNKDQLNVVFVLSDNQSYYELGCHGHPYIKSPNIDALARQSIEFSHFYAPNFCSPSRAVILTGQYAMRNGVFDTIGGRSLLHADATTLPEIMKQHGYQTGIFGKWHLGFSYPFRPRDRGFDEVFVHGGGGVGQLEDYYANTLFDTTFIHNGEIESTTGYCTDTLFDKAIEFIESNQDQPFFCYIPTPVTHFPNHGPKHLVEQLKKEGATGNVELFAQVMNLDENIGRLVDKLDELDLAERTIFVYASDQGVNDRGASHEILKQGLAYDPAHHVPFFIRIPGGKPRISSRLAGMIDFFPTILDLCEIESPTRLDGISLKPLLLSDSDRAEAYPDDRVLILQCPRGRTAQKWKNSSVKTERWRLTNGEKLYDITSDPRMIRDIAGDHPDVVAKLRAEYESYWSDLPDQRETLSRHVLGDSECDEVTLNAMDWYRGDKPWHSGAFKNRRNGAWPVRIVRDGTYIFECRHYPREADLPAEANHARLRVGYTTVEKKFDKSATHVLFEVELTAGEYDLETFMSNDDETPRGALFIYVSYKKTVR